MTKGHSSGSNLDGKGSERQLAGTSLRSEPVFGLASLMPRSAVAALLLCCSIAAQSPGVPPIVPAEGGQTTSRFPNREPANPASTSIDQKRVAALNRQRQRAIVDDTTKLLLLAKELNADSDRMSSAERVHKASEIEKLAKSVKEKMSYAVGDNPTVPGSVNLFP